jgi:hypothetical protein
MTWIRNKYARVPFPQYPLQHMLLLVFLMMARCPTTDEWIKKMWYLYTMEFYSAMKKNEILSFASKLMELENIILSEVSQTQKTKNHMFFLICGL